MNARFAGTCRRCHQPIEIGQEIAKTDMGYYAHTTCTPAAAPVADKPADLTPGVYEKDGQAYIVRFTKDKARLYAMKVVEISGTRIADETGEHVNVEFEFVKGMIYRLTPEDRMSVDRAKFLSIRYGRCIVCGAHLKDATSVERGIGPVCMKKLAA